jgi:hypothetical protein
MEWVELEIDGLIHVVPFTDIADHEDGFTCWCLPTYHPRGKAIEISHRASEDWYEPRGH